MASLSLKGITKVYAGGVTAVSDFNIEIADKEFIILVGPSGCGKSTTPVSYTHLKGNVLIDTDVISAIAGYVASNCYGVVGMASRNRANGLVSLLKLDTISKGVRVSCVEQELVIDLFIIVEYGVNVKTISQSIVGSVKYNVERLTGLKVSAVNIHVEGMRTD